MIPNNQFWFGNSKNKSNNFITATGGTITRNGNWLVHTFNSNGTFNITKYPTNSLLWVMCVAGGGGGASWYAGGSGGAGGYVNRAGYKPSLGLGSYNVIVGNGGLAGSVNTNSILADGNKGENSSFDNLIATGGGGGIHYTGANTGVCDGGSGGGIYGGMGLGNQPNTFPSQGNDAGASLFTGGQIYQGGGGGATTVGDPATGLTAVAGGLGATNYMTGSPIVYSTGGLGTYTNSDGISAASNTGNGGQGAGTLTGIGGNGGSGVVKIAYYSPIVDSLTINDLYNFNYGSSEYLLTGTMTPTFNPGSSVRLQGTNLPGNNNFVYVNNFYSDCANFVYQADVQFNSLGATDFGAGIRIHSLIYYGITLRVGAATGVNKGLVEACLHNTVIATLGTFSTLNVGDILNFKIFISNNTIIFTVVNGAQIITGSYVFNFDYTASPSFVSPIYTMAFATSGGDYLFSNATAKTSDKYQPDLMIAGDSRMYGLFAGGNTPNTRVSGLWQLDNMTKRVYNHSGSGETLANFILRVPEIIKYNPRNVIVYMIINDVIAGLNSNDTVTKLSKILYLLESRGISTKIQISPRCTGVDQTTTNAAVASNFPNHIIPEPADWNPAADTSPDGIHPLPASQIKIYNNQKLYITL